MDNFYIDVTAEGKQALKDTIGIAMRHNCAGDKVEAFAKKPLCLRNGERGPVSMVLYWHEDRGTTHLPTPLCLDAIVEVVWEWLQNEAEYREEPDHDGSNGRGFRVFTEGFWGHVDDSHYAICAIQPEWAMYGK